MMRRGVAGLPHHLPRRPPMSAGVTASHISQRIAPGVTGTGQPSWRGTGRCSGPTPIPTSLTTRSGPMVMTTATGPMSTTTSLTACSGARPDRPRNMPMQRRPRVRLTVLLLRPAQTTLRFGTFAGSPAVGSPRGRSQKSNARSDSTRSRRTSSARSARQARMPPPCSKPHVRRMMRSR